MRHKDDVRVLTFGITLWYLSDRSMIVCASLRSTTENVSSECVEWCAQHPSGKIDIWHEPSQHISRDTGGWNPREFWTPWGSMRRTSKWQMMTKESFNVFSLGESTSFQFSLRKMSYLNQPIRPLHLRIGNKRLLYSFPRFSQDDIFLYGSNRRRATHLP